jgi:hypothetical protein
MSYNKIGRDAFLYLAPADVAEERDFAQCGACRFFVPPGEDRPDGLCAIHGSYVKIGVDDSCCFFVGWATPDGKPDSAIVAGHAAELAKGRLGSVTPEESGLVDRLVQCQRCRFAADPEVTKCALFDELNRQFADIFDLDINIEKHACCNAQTPY